MTGLLPLWFGLLGPPVIWAIRFAVVYALVPDSCSRGSVWIMQGVTLAALAGTVWAGVVAWRAWRTAEEGEGMDLGVVRVRTRFMGRVGVLESALFFVVIVAEALAIFFIHPCQSGGVPL